MDYKIYILIYRWTKLRSAMCPIATFFEPFSECMVLGAISAWSVLFLFRWDPLAFFFVHILLWFVMDWALLLVVQVIFYMLLKEQPSYRHNFYTHSINMLIVVILFMCFFFRTTHYLSTNSNFW